MELITGFHAIEEYLKTLENLPLKTWGLKILFCKTGPRVKKILELAKKLQLSIEKISQKELDSLTQNLPEAARDHRGIVLTQEVSANSEKASLIDFDPFIANLKKQTGKVILLLDSITDPHNVGAIIRNCDQLGVDLVVLPENRGLSETRIIARSSAGASAWVPISLVPNLIRAVEKLQKSGFWVYGAAAEGQAAHTIDLSGNIALVMGSEGRGISRLLAEKCDAAISIPCCGKLDSLNVSVAAGILLYEIRRQKGFCL